MKGLLQQIVRALSLFSPITWLGGLARLWVRWFGLGPFSFVLINAVRNQRQRKRKAVHRQGAGAEAG